MNRAAAVGIAIALVVVGFATAVGTRALLGLIVIGAVIFTTRCATLPLRRQAVQGLRPLYLTLGTAAVIAGLNVYAPLRLSLSERALASSVIAIAVVPTALWLAGRDYALPIVPLFSAMYALMYASPVFLRKARTVAVYSSVAVSEREVVEALELAVVGLLILLSAYYWRVQRRDTDDRSRIGAPIETSGAPVTWALLGLVGLVVYVLSQYRQPPTIVREPVRLLADASVLASLTLYLFRRQGRLGVGGTLVLVGLVSARVLAGLNTGFLNQAIVPLLALVSAYAISRRRVPWMLLFIGVLALSVLQPAKVQYRVAYEGTHGYAYSPVSGTSAFASAALDVIGNKSKLSDSLDGLTSRLGYTMQLARVIDQTPRYVPYWGGHTLAPIPLKPIPRFVFPNKPQEVNGNVWGRRYGFVGPSDQTTSWGMSSLEELYANFGVAAVLGGMLIFGLFLEWMQHFCWRRIEPWLGTAASLYLLSQVMTLELSLSILVSMLLYGVIFIAGLGYVLRAVAQMVEQGAPVALSAIPKTHSGFSATRQME